MQSLQEVCVKRVVLGEMLEEVCEVLEGLLAGALLGDVSGRVLPGGGAACEGSPRSSEKCAAEPKLHLPAQHTSSPTSPVQHLQKPAQHYLTISLKSCTASSP
jgi:hypothetical protein